MGGFLQILKDKRIAVPASIIIVVGAIFFVLLSISGNSSNTAIKPGDDKNILNTDPNMNFRANNRTIDPQPKKEIIKMREISGTPINAVNVIKSDSDYLTVPGWVTNDNDIFTFFYPSNWKIESNLFAQGQTMIVKPETLPETEYVPGLVINVQLTDAAASTSASKEQVYQGLGYQTKNAMLDEKQWVVLTGVFPPVQSAPLPSGSYAYETQYYIDYKGISFQLIYKYPGTKENREYELLYQKMLSTFHIKA